MLIQSAHRLASWRYYTHNRKNINVTTSSTNGPINEKFHSKICSTIMAPVPKFSQNKNLTIHYTQIRKNLILTFSQECNKIMNSVHCMFSSLMLLLSSLYECICAVHRDNEKQPLPPVCHDYTESVEFSCRNKQVQNS